MAIRKDLDISEDELLCIWTGRLTSNKMPCLLARAVDELCMSGYKFRALFIGNGPAEGSLKKFSNITVLPFMPWSKLPPYYRAADIAVWPRSITTSTLDASACGLPIILSDQEKATERWKGIGLTYAEGDLSSLKNKLVMFLNNEYRKKLGQSAFLKMKTSFSWELIAKEFLEYFQNYSKINKMKSNYRSGS